LLANQCHAATRGIESVSQRLLRLRRPGYKQPGPPCVAGPASGQNAEDEQRRQRLAPAGRFIGHSVVWPRLFCNSQVARSHKPLPGWHWLLATSVAQRQEAVYLSSLLPPRHFGLQETGRPHRSDSTIATRDKREPVVSCGCAAQVASNRATLSTKAHQPVPPRGCAAQVASNRATPGLRLINRCHPATRGIESVSKRRLRLRRPGCNQPGPPCVLCAESLQQSIMLLNQGLQ